MKVCMLARSIPSHVKGGIEDHIFTLCQELVKKGQDVTIITTQHPQGIEYEVIDGIKIYYLKGTIPGRHSQAREKLSIEKFLDLHQKEKFDIIHCQGWLIKGIDKLNLPIVLSLHGTSIDEIKTAWNVLITSTNLKMIFISILKILFHIYTYLLGVKWIKKARGIIATSNEQKKILLEKYKVKKDKLYVVYNGIDIDLFIAQSSDLELLNKYGIKKDKEKVILCVARIIKEKGIQNIVKAMPNILKKVPSCKLLIVGDGKYRPELEKIVDRLGLQENIIITGLVPYEDLPQFYNLCDIFVNSTIRINGYDLTILQSMACRKPVVISNIGSVPTVITNYEDGILVPPGNIILLANAVIELLNNKELADRIAQKAREKIINKFSLESMVEGTIQVYNTLIKNQ